ncbi:hypothetical protein [Cryptosporangium phraense]|uniref:Uncharacterized protein n=1 Tax=Cryptosporangium phraense TaxID=2593070 RepID=A0A545AZU1_9ACTN|nr:hypothetical protein [Cryptosporangium phraense]TQS46829.1 hypothetical protein FL583_00690 [Cryptosporangium phraense]
MTSPLRVTIGAATVETVAGPAPPTGFGPVTAQTPSARTWAMNRRIRPASGASASTASRTSSGADSRSTSTASDPSRTPSRMC